ncbi:type 1 fimbrial protein, partial [Acinetobacter baumannii]|nr:type 1 fimbrial protein [Acinetobacter baumannii]
GKPAGSVGILLTDRTGTPIGLDAHLDPQHDPRIEIPVDGGSGTFSLKAFYYTWDKAHVLPGDGNATARFTIMQE